MDLTVTYAQFRALKTTMNQATVLYARDGTEPTLVRRAALLDPKLGGATFSWSTAAEQPPVASFLADFTGALEVADIT